MKKYFSIAAAVLAVLSLSSCEKNDDASGDQGASVVNTWVSDEMPITSFGSIEIGDYTEGLPQEAVKALTAALANAKFQVVLDLKADGNGQAGILVDKAKLNLMVQTVKTLLETYGAQIPAEKLQEINAAMAAAQPLLEALKDNDYVGVTYTYTVNPADAASGKIIATVQSVGDDETEDGEKDDNVTEMDYSGLSADAVTVTGMDDGKPVTFNFRSASASGVTVGSFKPITDYIKVK